MGAWGCPACGHGRFVVVRSTRYCARLGCSHAEHISSAAKPVVVDRRGEWQNRAPVKKRSRR